MTSSGQTCLNIRTNASPKCDRTRCPMEKASSPLLARGIRCKCYMETSWNLVIMLKPVIISSSVTRSRERMLYLQSLKILLVKILKTYRKVLKSDAPKVAKQAETKTDVVINQHNNIFNQFHHWKVWCSQNAMNNMKSTVELGYTCPRRPLVQQQWHSAISWSINRDFYNDVRAYTILSRIWLKYWPYAHFG